jgi:PTH1 family peptidyl-tRNA hydrolase
MNLSGDCVQPAAAFVGASVGDIVVVHDELDLPFGDVRIKVGGGHAGHNGLRSLIQRLGSADFARVRVGIGRPPPGDAGHGMDVAGWVLSRFDPSERAELPSVVTRAADAVERILRDGPDAAMLAVHTRAASTASTKR